MNNISPLRKALLGLVALLLMLACDTDVVAQSGEIGESGERFEVGGSCAALAFLDSGELKQYTTAAYSDDFHSFCYPEEPFSCSDYTSFLKGLGRMTVGDDGYHCSLQLQL